MILKEEIDEEALTPKSRRSIPKKRKSKKDGEVRVSWEEIPSQ